MPRLGIAKVCCTEQFAHESKVDTDCVGVVLPLLKYETFSTSPATPVTCPQTGFRNGVQPSYPRIVTFTLVLAGTAKYVV